jgi:hypothetical protein
MYTIKKHHLFEQYSFVHCFNDTSVQDEGTLIIVILNKWCQLKERVNILMSILESYWKSRLFVKYKETYVVTQYPKIYIQNVTDETIVNYLFNVRFVHDKSNILPIFTLPPFFDNIQCKIICAYGINAEHILFEHDVQLGPLKSETNDIFHNTLKPNMYSINYTSSNTLFNQSNSYEQTCVNQNTYIGIYSDELIDGPEMTDLELLFCIWYFTNNLVLLSHLDISKSINVYTTIHLITNALHKIIDEKYICIITYIRILIYEYISLSLKIPKGIYEDYMNKYNNAHIGPKYQIKIHKTMQIDAKTIDIDKKLSELFTNPKIQIMLQKLDSLDDDPICVKSIDFFTSFLTLSSWTDECANRNAIGLPMNIYIPDYCRTGNMDNIAIIDLSLAFVPIVEYIGGITKKLEKNNTRDINSTYFIVDAIIGKPNICLPLYIHKLHWEISKIYLPSLLGLLFTNNPMLYNQKMQNIYYFILTELFYGMFIMHSRWSNHWINTSIAFLRTCAQISFEHRYHKGFSRHFDNLMINNFDGITFNVLCGMILSVNYEPSDDAYLKMCDCFIEKIISEKLSSEYNMEFIQWCIDAYTNNNAELITKIDSLKKFLLIDTKLILFCDTLKILYTGVAMIKTLKLKYGGFNKILKIIDDNFGIVPPNIENYIVASCNGAIEITTKMILATIGILDYDTYIMNIFVNRVIIKNKVTPDTELLFRKIMFQKN